MSRIPLRRLVPALAVTLAAVGAVVAADKPAKPGTSDKPAKAKVEMKRMQFIPEEVTIKKGGTVQWVNNDDRDYLIVADDNSWKSENLRPKETFEHTFKEAGTFGYKNMLRPRSTGTVIVTE